MPHCFKLARRLARLRFGTTVMVAGSLTLAGCTSDDPTEPETAAVPAQDHTDAAATTDIAPGQSIQERVNSFPAGTTFRLKAGKHRMQQVTPKNGNVFIGESGAIMSGARQLTSFTRSGGYWVASGQTQQGTRTEASRENGLSTCDPEFPRCYFPEQLFLDGKLLKHVSSLSQVGPGKWFFDYGADKIYFGDDPTGHVIETSVTPYAFKGQASNVTITGLVIERYANPSGDGAIHGHGGSGWTVSDNELRWNHGTGLKLGSGMRALRNNSHHNGHLGMNGTGISDALVENNEIAYNNTAGFRATGFSGGGAKFTKTTRLTIRGNRVHDNVGKGLWTDIYNRYVLYENNVVTNNDLMGIFHEVGYDAVIRNNTVEGNGFKVPAGTMRGGGIAVVSSSNVEIYGNIVRNNQHGISVNQDNRGSGPYGVLEVKNLYVHDNQITMTTGYTGLGLGQGVSGGTYYTSKNNRFVRNSYVLGKNARYFYWHDDDRTTAEWKSYGQDTGGTFSVR
ncbi:MAG TPA: right-handed parallel beta-helix repeat-containing protein [Gemmatimonadales bacterium]|nr:right-handed parallel beta-helix repeat-containing protein [Gemmatimonadales bacterium]